MTVIYESTFHTVGAQVPEFLEHGILILFGTGAPAELHDMSVLHDVSVCVGGPRPGDLVEFGDHSIGVLATGSVAEQNLMNLGHLDFKADGATEAALPGDVCVARDSLIPPEPGMRFRILRPDTERSQS